MFEDYCMVFLDDKEKAEILKIVLLGIFFSVKEKELQTLEVELSWLTGI